MSTRQLELETIHLEQQDRVLIARIDNPPFNYMTAGVQRDLDVLTTAVDGDRSVGAVIVTGAPADRYITHFDIADILHAVEHTRRGLSERTLRTIMRGVDAARRIPGADGVLESSPISGLLNVTRFNEVVLRIMRSPAVYIAAINGPCGGGGLELSVCFDVRISAEEGAGYILPELLIGLTTTVGAQRLTQLIGPARALEFMLEGRMYSPQEALEMGLVGQCAPRDELLDRALELGRRYAKRNRQTVAAQKRIFNQYALLSPEDSLRAEGASNAAGILAGVAPQALRAWVEMQRQGDGDSVFLTNPEPWQRGEVVDLNADSE